MAEITFPYKTIKDIDIKGKRILMRADYNVPLSNGHITDDFRITASIPTINYLVDKGAKVVLISHLGRPKGKVNPEFSLAPVAKSLEKKLSRPVRFIDNCIGPKVEKATSSMKSGEVVLLENLRFHKEETDNDFDFATHLASDSQASIFVQDGFGVVHRSHASTDAITQILPAVAGLLLEQEYVSIKTAVDSPNRPLTTVIGGAKISDKMPLVEKFLEAADNIIVGGALANNFLKHQGFDVGNSLVEDGADNLVAEIIATAKEKYGDDLFDNFILPVDVAVSEDGSLDGAERIEKSIDEVSGSSVIYDLGTKTIDRIDDIIEKSGTVIWNGTLGMAQYPEFSRGSARLALALAKRPHIASIIGGGDTADFVRHWDALKGGSFTHVSTGGGASLELMAGNVLPGISSLITKE